MKKAEKGLLAAAAATGAALAYYMHKKEKKATDGGEIEIPSKTPIHHACPVSALLENQINLDLVSSERLRSWFVEKTDSQTAGKTMIVAAMYDHVIASLGYELDIKLDRDHYLLLQIRDIDSQDYLKECVVNFTEMSAELKKILDGGNGIFKVNG